MMRKDLSAAKADPFTGPYIAQSTTGTKEFV